MGPEDVQLKREKHKKIEREREQARGKNVQLVACVAHFDS